MAVAGGQSRPAACPAEPVQHQLLHGDRLLPLRPRRVPAEPGPNSPVLAQCVLILHLRQHIVFPHVSEQCHFGSCLQPSLVREGDSLQEEGHYHADAGGATLHHQLPPNIPSQCKHYNPGKCHLTYPSK